MNLRDAARRTPWPCRCCSSALWWVLTLDSENFFVPQPAPLATTFADTWFGERLHDRRRAQPRCGSPSASPRRSCSAIGLGLRRSASLGWVRRLTEPLLEFFRAVPPPVLVPVLMLILGISDSMKVAVIVSGCDLAGPAQHRRGRARRSTPCCPTPAAPTGSTARNRFRFLVLPQRQPADHGRHPAGAVGRPDPHGHQRDVRLVVGTRLHDRPVPAQLRDRRDVERHRRARAHRRPAVRPVPARRAASPALVPRHRERCNVAAESHHRHVESRDRRSRRHPARRRPAEAYATEGPVGRGGARPHVRPSRRGELACIVGPSGAGKTTLLRCIAGLLDADRGLGDARRHDGHRPADAAWPSSSRSTAAASSPG